MHSGARSSAEPLKEQSRHLRGTIAAELANESAQFSRAAAGLLRFHGSYQQDDRDKRKTQPAKEYSMMVRVGVPGGRLSAEQYLELDRLADAAGDGTLRITSRQGVQYHYVGKRSLRELIGAIAATGLSTWGACGDVVRNVVSCAAPVGGPEREAIGASAQMLRTALRPRSAAYAEIWQDGEKAVSWEQEQEPLYGETYLPRKFKIGFAVEGENTTDVYSNDLGFVGHFSDGKLEGFTALAGGGLGQSFGVKQSYPRLADPFAFVSPEELLAVSEAVVSIHRDFGDRLNRKRARLKYVIEARGIGWFRGEVETRLGRPLAPPRPLAWQRHADYLGWNEQGEGRWFFGLRVISGRVEGALRRAVAEILRATGCGVRFTVQQNLLFTDLAAGQRAELEALLRRHGVPLPGELPPVLRYSMACPALPTCGQAITESERVLPAIAAAVQAEWDAAGVGVEGVHLRQTGCPNGCARPYTAEIGIVGQSVGLYTIYLGGSPLATRLGQPFRELVKEAEIAATLRPVIRAFAAGRAPGEAFGDYCHRQGIAALRALAE